MKSCICFHILKEWFQRLCQTIINQFHQKWFSNLYLLSLKCLLGLHESIDTTYILDFWVAIFLGSIFASFCLASTAIMFSKINYPNLVGLKQQSFTLHMDPQVNRRRLGPKKCLAGLGSMSALLFFDPHLFMAMTETQE